MTPANADSEAGGGLQDRKAASRQAGDTIGKGQGMGGGNAWHRQDGARRPQGMDPVASGEPLLARGNGSGQTHATRSPALPHDVLAGEHGNWRSRHVCEGHGRQRLVAAAEQMSAGGC